MANFTRGDEILSSSALNRSERRKLSGWQALVIRLGRRRSLVAVTTLSVVLSTSLAWMLGFAFGAPDEFTHIFMAIATVVPLVIAPLVTHLLIQIVFELEKTRVSLTRIARIDEMTNLCNRRFFMERLRFEIARAHAMSLPLSICLIDVDHFKRINDQYGHPTGDAVLTAIGVALSTTVRSTDLPARFGGEEFIILLPDTLLEAAGAMASRVLEGVNSRPIVLENIPSISCTVSAGVATLLPAEQDETALVQRADAALYRAKAAGRNRWSA